MFRQIFTEILNIFHFKGLSVRYIERVWTETCLKESPLGWSNSIKEVFEKQLKQTFS